MAACTFGSGPHPFGRGGETLQCFGDRGHGESLIFPLGFGSCVAAVGSWEFLPGGICLHFLVMKWPNCVHATWQPCPPVPGSLQG